MGLRTQRRVYAACPGSAGVQRTPEARLGMAKLEGLGTIRAVIPLTVTRAALFQCLPRALVSSFQ